jgi:hypothetical protein
MWKYQGILIGILFIICGMLNAFDFPDIQGGVVEEEKVGLVSDGPYVEWSGTSAKILRKNSNGWYPEDRLGSFLLELPGITETPFYVHPWEPPSGVTEIDDHGKFIAISDVHGHFNKLKHLLEVHGVVDQRGQWTYGSGHLIVVGDTTDRGDEVTECLWFLKSLESHAEKFGGSVQVLLGNHEAMDLSGSYRYVDSKYKRRADNLPSLQERFSSKDEIGRWLRSRSVVLKVGKFLFTHAGISPRFLKANLTLEQCNQYFHSLTNWKSNDFLLGRDGPLKYDKLVSKRTKIKDLNNILSTFKVEHIVVGHKTFDQIRTFHEKKVIGIDAGIVNNNSGEVLIWENQLLYRGTANGEKEELTYNL